MIDLCIIATGKYKGFIPNLLASAKQYFLPNHHVNYHLFVDQEEGLTGDIHIIPPYKFPYATLYRYKIMTEVEFKGSHVFYIDADSLFVDEVGDEILVDGLFAVAHPGFYAMGGGSWETREQSQAYVEPEKRNIYYCGGISGGEREAFVDAMHVMRSMISADETAGIVPVHNDESVWNAYLAGKGWGKSHIINTFEPGYMMVEELHLRKKWGIDHLKPRILALRKNHQDVRK